MPVHFKYELRTYFTFETKNMEVTWKLTIHIWKFFEIRFKPTANTNYKNT